MAWPQQRQRSSTHAYYIWFTIARGVLAPVQVALSIKKYCFALMSTRWLTAARNAIVRMSLTFSQTAIRAQKVSTTGTVHGILRERCTLPS